MAVSRSPASTSSFTHYVLRLTPYAPLLTLIALATYPILASGLPTTGDGLNHYYRLAELDWHIRHGDLYPRWFANMGYGFGLPVLNFYSPLTYYIPFLFRLLGLSLATSLQLSYALALAVAILGAYCWALSISLPMAEANEPTTKSSNHLTALIAAAAYGLAPYFYFNIFHRGAYPETWALALAPWLLWSVHRLFAKPNSFVSHIPFICLSSAIILTHTLSALILLPVFCLYGLSIVLVTTGWHNAVSFVIRHLSFVILMSFLLTAFFTLPLLFESQHIQLSRTYSTGDLDYHRNFLTLASLLSRPPNFDPLLVFNSIPPSLGWPQAVLGLLTLGIALFGLRQKSVVGRLPAPFERRGSSVVILLSAFCLLLSAFTLSFTEPLWNLFPFSRFIQFPWRLVGPASLLLSVLAGLAIGLIRNQRLAFGSWVFGISPLFGGLCLGFFLFSLSWTYHADFSLQSLVSDSPTDTIRYEIDSGQLGTSSTGEYLPRWVTELPEPQTLLPQFAATDRPSRLAPLPDAVTNYELRNALNSESLTYTAPTPFTATFNLFYFPGWVATLDGQPVEIQPSSPNGLITIPAPAGTHTLGLERQLTLPQLIGGLISFISILSLIIYAITILRRSLSPPLPSTSAPERSEPLSALAPALLSLFIISLLAARIFYFDRAETIFHHTNIGNVPNPSSISFENQLELIGYEFAPTATSTNQLPVTLYWRAIQPLSADYSVSVQLADRFGNRFGQSDSQHPNGVPTSRWRVEQYARDTHQLLSLEGTPPGDYRLLVTVYGERPLSILENGAPIGVEYELGSVRIEAIKSNSKGPLALIEADLATDTVMVGDQLNFTTLWFAGDQPVPSLNAFVELVNNSGQVLYAESIPPAGPDYPTEQWLPGSKVRYPFNITLPPELPGGAARVRLSLVEASGAVAAGPYEVGSINITVPERSFEIPEMQVRVDHDFGDAVRLLGYDVQDDSITLYWQSLKAISKRLTVFVHTLDESGAFVNGHDAGPARATTSWLPGEVITDSHPIVITEHFEVGLYDPITGERFGKTFVTAR